MGFLTSLIPGLPSWAWRWIAIAVMAAVAFGYGFVKGLDHGASKLAACSASVQKAQDNVASLTGALDRQNAAVRALEADTKARRAKAEKALQEASREAQAARSDAARLRALPAPNDCHTALEAVRKGLAR